MGQVNQMGQMGGDSLIEQINSKRYAVNPLQQSQYSFNTSTYVASPKNLY